MSEEESKKIKKELRDFLRKLNLIKDKDTGHLIIHLNDGGITKIFKNVEMMK